MMNVLYITDTLKQRFGVTSVIMNYLEQFRQTDIHIDLLVYPDSEPEMIQRAKELGAQVFFMPKLSIKNLLKYLKFIKNFFQTHPYDIVHSHFNQVDMLIFPVARKHGVKICISHSHNTKLSDNCLKAVRNRLLCWNIAGNGDILAACSEKAGLALYGNSFTKSNKKLLIHNGVNINKFSFNPLYRDEIRQAFGITPDDILLGHIGSFKIQKNQTYLIQIFSQLCHISSRYKLLLVGDGETRTEVQSQANRAGISDKVIFAGVRTDIPKILSAIDLFLLPSLYEGLPVIGIEAQAAGLECLFADTITREVNLTNVKFLALDPDPQNWVNAIIKSEVRHHAEYAQQLIERGYSIEQESQKLKELYQKLVTSHELGNLL